MSNYIFLDIDGVLNNKDFLLKSKREFGGKIDDRSVQILKRICKEFDAKVVLSSSWRRNLNPDLTLKMHLVKLKDQDMKIFGPDYETNTEKLLRTLKENEIELVGITDTETHLLDHIKWDRSGQIARYIQNNFKDEDRFIILDDDDLVTEGARKYRCLGKCFVQTDFDDLGLDEKAYQKAKKIFKDDELWKNYYSELWLHY